MSSGQQSQAIAGMARETTYGTGVACTRFLPFKTEDLQAKRTPVMSSMKQGAGGAKEFSGDGPVTGGGPIVEYARYDLNTDPVHMLLEQIFGKGRGHWYRKIMITSGLSAPSWITLRQAATTGVELADKPPVLTIQASTNVTVRRWLKRLLQPAGETNGIWIEIQTDSGGLPSGTPVTNGVSAYVPTASITADSAGEEIEFTFAVSPTLAISTQYHKVLKGDYTASATAAIQMLVETGATGGTYEQKNASYAADATKNGIGRGLCTDFIDTYIMAKTNEGLGTSLAIDKGQRVHQWQGVKAEDLTITSKPPSEVELSWTTVLQSEQAVGSISTTSGQLSGLKTSRGKVLHTDLTFNVSDQTAALAVGTVEQVDSATFSLKRPLDKIVPSGSDKIIEPLENANRDVSLTFELPRYQANTYKTWAIAKTPVQGKLLWTAPAGGKYFTLLLPNGRIMGDVDIPTDGEKSYPQKITVVFGLNLGQFNNPFICIAHEAELTLLSA